MTQLLLDRVAQQDLANLPEWQVADILNAPDTSLPVIVSWEKTSIGPGAIMAVLGAVEGANILDAIAFSTNPVMRWGMKIIEAGSFDLSLPTSRAQVEELVRLKVITEDQKDILFSLSKRERYPSWAEYNNISVDAQSVHSTFS
jgi:hypothetical protein